MRKIIVISMITLDVVMQASGGPEEDTSGGFKYGGWSASYGDELWLKIFQLTLGKGKKLFDNGTIPAAFTLIESSVTPSGVIIANYKRAGKDRTGTVGS
jgi:hypothetical protein